jgi:phosphate:Na+ symporter
VGTLVLLDLMGGVALLLWGLHMVHSGILRAFGSELRSVMRTALGNRFSAMFAGLGLTALLQSSTATGLMTASFAADGTMALVPALAVMLGANIGTTLIVEVLSFNLSALAPILLVVGVIAFKSSDSGRLRDLGRVAIGLGLMLLALHLLLNSLAPAENAPAVRSLLGAITDDPVFCILVAALLTWAAHSSVAVVLLIMSLAFSNFITPEATLALVLGANLGSAINPVFEGGTFGDLSSRRMPVGNLINRLVGIVLVLPFLHPLATLSSGLFPDPAKMTAAFHVAFNIATAALFIGLLDPMARLLTWMLPAPRRAADPGAPRYLDENEHDTPSLALGDAARETLRVGDLIEVMLRQVMTALMTNDRHLVVEVSRMDDIVDRLDEAIKLYVIKLTRGSLSESEGRRAMEIISFAINLEHIGDIIDKNLCETVVKKIRHQARFSVEGAAELEAFHRRILGSLKMALSVFMSSDVEAARCLVDEKTALRNEELVAADRHLARLREGRPESLDTTSLHLDVLRDLRRIHSHLVAVAYPVLEAAGEPHTEARLAVSDNATPDNHAADNAAAPQAR